LASLAPAERLAEYRRLGIGDSSTGASAAALRPPTPEELLWLANLPPAERLREARRLGIE
jgi:hypothetical protein